VHKLDIKGRLEKIPDFKSPFTYRNNARRDSVINFLLAKFVSASRLKVAQKKCIKCKRCYDNCPAGAILTNNKHLRIDTTKCILCFCCKEICPNDAITIKGLFGMVQKVFK